MGQISLIPSYCIDTSALIDAWRVNYPPKVFPTLWAEDLVNLISEGILIAPQQVFEELKQGDDELFEWAKTLKITGTHIDGCDRSWRNKFVIGTSKIEKFK